PSAFGGHGAHDDVEEAVQQLDHVVGGQRLGESRRPDEVDEKGADLAAFAAQAHAVFQGIPGHVLTDVAAEQVLQLPALAKAGDHLVEAGLEQTDLGAVVDCDFDVEVAGLHTPHRTAKLAQRIGDGTGGDVEDD